MTKARRFVAYFHVVGSRYVANSFTVEGFHFGKSVDKGQILVSYTLNAKNKGDARRQLGEIKGGLESVLTAIAFATAGGLEILGEPAVLPQGEDYNYVEIAVSISDKSATKVQSIYDRISPTLKKDAKLRLATRWLRKALLAEFPEDQFLALWIALEAQAEQRERSGFTGDLIETYNHTKDCITKYLGEAPFFAQAISEWGRLIKRQSIAEAIACEIKETLGSNYSLFGRPLIDEIRQLQQERSRLVHDGIMIPKIRDKTSNLKDAVHAMLAKKLSLVRIRVGKL